MDGDDGANTSRVWSWKFQDSEGGSSFGPDRVNTVHYTPDNPTVINVILGPCRINPDDIYSQGLITKEDIYTEFTKYFPYDDPDDNLKFRL